MAMIEVQVHRPVMGLKPGTTAEVDDEDERVQKMIQFGHLFRMYPGEEPEPAPQET